MRLMFFITIIIGLSACFKPEPSPEAKIKEASVQFEKKLAVFQIGMTNLCIVTEFDEKKGVDGLERIDSIPPVPCDKVKVFQPILMPESVAMNTVLNPYSAAITTTSTRIQSPLERFTNLISK